MYSDTLIVVDMQAQFSPVHDQRLLYHVKYQIGLAKRRNAYIFFLEFIGYGKTVLPIVRSVMTYKRILVIKKNARDGSTLIAPHIDKLGIDPGRFRVCGLYTDQCVKATVNGLAQRFPEAIITIPAFACKAYARYGITSVISAFADCERKSQIQIKRV